MNRGESDSGFTLVELLVVLVIMPLVVGGIAAAIIVSYKDSGLAQNRLTDSSNAQISSEYFIRDVQGARYVFAPDPGSPRPAGPQPYPVCTGTHLDPTASLLLALYRPSANTTDTEPATLSSSALSVAYWVTPGTNNQMQLVRYSCPQGGHDDHCRHVGQPHLPRPRSASCRPSSATRRKQVGPPPQPRPSSRRAFTLPVSSIPVASTAGFASGPVGCGPQPASRRSPAPWIADDLHLPADRFRTVQNGAQVSQQASISGISISVTQPGSGYTYSLQAVPRCGHPDSQSAPSVREPRMPPPSSAFHDVSVTNGSTLSVNGSATVGADSWRPSVCGWFVHGNRRDQYQRDSQLHCR